MPISVLRVLYILYFKLITGKYLLLLKYYIVDFTFVEKVVSVRF